MPNCALRSPMPVHCCTQVRVVQRDLLDLEELCEAAGLPLTPA